MLVSVLAGSKAGAIAMLGESQIDLVWHRLEGWRAAFSPSGDMCAWHDSETYALVEFPGGFARGRPSRAPVFDDPTFGDETVRAEVMFLDDATLLETSVDASHWMNNRPKSRAARVSILSAATCERVSDIVITPRSAAVVPYERDAEPSPDACDVDAVHALFGRRILTHDPCCGYRLWNASSSQ